MALTTEIRFKTNSFDTTCIYCKRNIHYDIPYKEALVKSPQKIFGICRECFNDEKAQKFLLKASIKQTVSSKLHISLDKLDFIELAVLYDMIDISDKTIKDTSTLINEYEYFINAYQITGEENASN